MAKPMRFASKMSLFLILKPAHFSSASMRRGYWKIRAGLLQKNAPLQLPVTLGGDFSGVVEAVGPGATDFDIGVAVYGQASPTSGGSGSFADFAIAPARCAAQKPKSPSHAQAAALPLTGVSAPQALTEHMHLTAGQKLLIHGGAGGIGGVGYGRQEDYLSVRSTVSRSIAAPGTLVLRRSQASPSRSARSASQTASRWRSETGTPFADPASAPRTRA